MCGTIHSKDSIEDKHKQENKSLDFKTIFLETLEQDRYGLSRDSGHKGGNDQTTDKTVTVALPNIHARDSPTGTDSLKRSNI